MLLGALLATPGTALAQEPPTTDVAACRDGDCTIRVTGPVEIPLDGRVGPTALSVSQVGRYAVVFTLATPTGRSYAATGTGGTVEFGSERGTLTVRVLELRDGAAVLELSTGPA